MKFNEALEEMKKGKNVRRKNSYIRIHHAKNEFTNHNREKIEVTPFDLISDDWEVVE